MLDTAKDRRKTLKTEKEERKVRKSQTTTINIFLNLLSYHITRKMYILLEKFLDKLNSYCNICITFFFFAWLVIVCTGLVDTVLRHKQLGNRQGILK